MTKKPSIPDRIVESKILLIRGKKVMIDKDIAELYGVTTKRLNEQVKRNHTRFPEDFMFQLTGIEKSEVVANCDHLNNLKYSPNLPYAFTEYGVVMLASVLKSKHTNRKSFYKIKRNGSDSQGYPIKIRAIRKASCK